MRVASRFGIKFPNFFESIFQALRRFCSVLNGLRPGKVARLNRFFQDDLHGLREFVIPGIQLAFVIVKFHTDLKMNNARGAAARALKLRLSRLHVRTLARRSGPALS
jgi:hypothetical protein